jgi:GxxExxY protein
MQESDGLDELDALARAVVDAAFHVHQALGPGLLESAYEVCLCHELAKRGLKFERQVSVPVEYENIKLDAGFRIDVLVGHCLIVEIKAVETLVPLHRAQLMTYLRLKRLRLGLLINFNVVRFKDGIRRIIL